MAITTRGRGTKQGASLTDRIQKIARQARDEVRSLRLGRARNLLLRKARQTEMASDIVKWLTSPGLRAPK